MSDFSVPIEIAFVDGDSIGLQLSETVQMLPFYDGAHKVTPGFETQTLATKGKSMREDVTVEAITVSRTANASGGNTVYIGGSINGERV